MKPAPFAYHRAENLDQALALLDRHGDEARLLAGGQSLVPMLNLRIARFGHLIDINPLHDLDYVREAGGGLEIGALTRHVTLERSELIRRLCPILAAVARSIGHVAIRERGTLGGSLALADPAGDLPLIAVLLHAELEIASTSGRRRVRARDFFLGVMTTALEPGEVLVCARFPAMVEGEGFGLHAVTRRAGDFAIVHAAVTVRMEDGQIADLRMALGGVGATPLALDALEHGQVGVTPDAAWAAAVARAAAAEVHPHDDPHASAEYRRDLVAVLLERALGDALSGAR
jgi:aerobic carbon-monoxide dehydrogenase medium subunit